MTWKKNEKHQYLGSGGDLRLDISLLPIPQIIRQIAADAQGRPTITSKHAHTTSSRRRKSSCDNWSAANRPSSLAFLSSAAVPGGADSGTAVPGGVDDSVEVDVAPMTEVHPETPVETEEGEPPYKAARSGDIVMVIDSETLCVPEEDVPKV